MRVEKQFHNILFHKSSIHYNANSEIQVRIEKIDLETKKKIILSREDGAAELAKTKLIVEGANLEVNEYGNTIFADFFFFITGFHGFHVFYRSM